jgi:hypothetical protein
MSDLHNSPHLAYLAHLELRPKQKQLGPKDRGGKCLCRDSDIKYTVTIFKAIAAQLNRPKSSKMEVTTSWTEG